VNNNSFSHFPLFLLILLSGKNDSLPPSSPSLFSPNAYSRFSKDQDVLDNNLPHVIQDCFECGVIVLCSIGLICIITPLFTLPLIGLGIYLHFLLLISNFFFSFFFSFAQCFCITTSKSSTAKRTEKSSDWRAFLGHLYLSPFFPASFMLFIIVLI
jgi:hypothetical protein